MKLADFTLVIQGMSVDTLLLFIQLAADTESAYKEIDWLFETDRPRFQRLATLSPYANHPLFTSGNIDRQIYAAKYSGLLLAAIEAGCDSPLFTETIAIMIKRWHELYYYIANCDVVDLFEVSKPKYYAKPANHKQSQNLIAGAATRYINAFVAVYPNLDLPFHASIKFALFMACASGKKVIVSDSTSLSFIQILSSGLNNTNEIKLLKNRLNKPTVKKSAQYLKNVIYQKVFNNYCDPWCNDRLLEGLAHCNAYLSLEEGISLLSLRIITQAKERDVELLCRLYIVKMAAEAFRSGYQEKSKEEMELDCAEFVMLGLNLLDFIREYKKAKKYYFEQNAAHLSTEVDNLKNQLENHKLALNRISLELKAKTTLLAVKEEETNRLFLQQMFIINSLTKENEQLKANLAQLNAGHDKVDNIKALSINTITPAFHRSYTIESALQSLKNVDALVIGGTENWQAKLKSRLPHFTYLNGDATNFDEALIIHADIVLANVRCKFSHDCFYKMIKIVRQYGKRIVFLSKTNIPLTIRQIANAINEPSATGCNIEGRDYKLPGEA